MSLQDLFGSDSENSDDGKITAAGDGQEELQSTQAHMNELFGDSDADDNDNQNDNASSGSSSSDEQDSLKHQSALNNATKMDNTVDDDLNFSDDNDVDQEAGPSKINQGSDDEAAVPTTQDLFGEELDVSSDEDERKDSLRESPMEDDQEESHEKERPPTPEKEEEEGLSIAIELPRCNISLGKELYFIKLPNFLSVDTKPFDPNFYEDEIDDDEILDEEGRTRLKLKVENTIRWRYSKDKDGNEIKESNCRFVRWSDGSISMHLGTEVFDVFKMPVEGEQNHLFVQQGTGLQAQAVFKNKLSFRPHSTASQTHRKMTMSIADRMSKAQKIKMMPAMERDPESQRHTMLRKEDERLRAQSRRENQQRRMREKSHAKGLSRNYLEQDMEDEDDFEHSIAAIKNKYAKDVKGARNKPFNEVYSDDDSEGEGKLRSAKLDIESDDEDDDDIKRKREELSKKKKLGRKVIEESDDESDG